MDQTGARLRRSGGRPEPAERARDHEAVDQSVEQVLGRRRPGMAIPDAEWNDRPTECQKAGCGDEAKDSQVCGFIQNLFDVFEQEVDISVLRY